MGQSKVLVRRVDDVGIALWGFGDRVLDVLFDGRRVWSFWLVRDTAAAPLGRRTIEWPRPLRRFLDGATRLTVREHVGGTVLFDEELVLGAGTGRIEIVNSSGASIGLDKSGRISATFDTRSANDVRPLLTAIGSVLDLVESAGIEAFLGYGTLLGAVREQRFLGHDSDADLAYVSRWTTPVDVVRESFRLQRVIAQRGFHTHRYSGAAFRVDVVEGDGVVRGLDVFAGFIDDGRLYLMGEVGADFEMSWVYPRSTCILEGQEFPGPAVPERLLEAMYGPSWRVPDPAFQFETSPGTEQKLTGWFRGQTVNQQSWQRHFSQSRNTLPPRQPSALARRAFRELGAGARVVDVGAGRGRDSLWMARRGLHVTAYDFVPHASTAVQRVAARHGLPLDVRYLNLTDRRSVLGEGARLAHGPRVDAMLAVHVADATSPLGRDSLARLASMSLRGGGRLYLDVRTGSDPGGDRVRALRLEDVARRMVRAGARILESRELSPRSNGNSRRFSIGRLVAQWE